jgi:hypothetical protein
MSIETPTAPALDGPDEARAVHAGWSRLNLEFLDFAARNPEYLEHRTFDYVHDAHWLRKLEHQCWPLFVDEPRRREVERMTLGIDRLVRGVVERFLGNTPARLMEFYRGAALSERRLEAILAEPTGVRGIPARGDYLEDAEGLKFLEYNAGSLGGVQTGLIGELHLAHPPLARFLEASGRRARAADTLGAFCRHLVDETARLGAWTEGELNVAVVNRPGLQEYADLDSGEMYDAALQRVLRERGMTGRAFECATDDFTEEAGALVAAGRPVHVVLQLHGPGGNLRFPYMMSKMGCVNFVGGPIGNLISDKRNVALLSEHAGSDEFTGAERDLIERHVPWTRIVRPEATTFRGRPFHLPGDLVEWREALVLKAAGSRGGDHVVVGRFCTDAGWRQAVARAVEEGDWIVQAYVEPVPYWFQRGEAGAARHDMVWGLFAFGDHFGGAVLRMQPHDAGTGVVNSAQGAEVGYCLYVDEDG